MTKGLKKYAVYLGIISTSFFALNSLVFAGSTKFLPVIAVLELLFLYGAFKGAEISIKHENRSKSRLNLWTTYIAVAFVVPFIMSSLISLPFSTSNDRKHIIVSAFILAGILFVLWLLNVGKFKGIDKKELFK